jgi:hypothetical protein
MGGKQISISWLSQKYLGNKVYGDYITTVMTTGLQNCAK